MLSLETSTCNATSCTKNMNAYPELPIWSSEKSCNECSISNSSPWRQVVLQRYRHLHPPNFVNPLLQQTACAICEYTCTCIHGCEVCADARRIQLSFMVTLPMSTPDIKHDICDLVKVQTMSTLVLDMCIYMYIYIYIFMYIYNCLRQTRHRAQFDRPINRFIPWVIGLLTKCASVSGQVPSIAVTVAVALLSA